MFTNKIIYCPCDDAESNFCQYFIDNIEKLKYNKVVMTKYNKITGIGKISYILPRADSSIVSVKSYSLAGDGDFRSSECTAIRDSADFIITNPPFSLWREFYNWAKKAPNMLIMANLNTIFSKDIFPDLVEHKIWCGASSGKMIFDQPDKSSKTMNNVVWITNIPHRSNPELQLKKNSSDYTYFDNQPIINIDRYKDIPENYTGIIGVPISFLPKINYNQFTIIGEAHHGSDNKYDLFKPIVGGKEKYTRLLIQRKDK